MNAILTLYLVHVIVEMWKEVFVCCVVRLGVGRLVDCKAYFRFQDGCVCHTFIFFLVYRLKIMSAGCLREEKNGRLKCRLGWAGGWGVEVYANVRISGFCLQ